MSQKRPRMRRDLSVILTIAKSSGGGPAMDAPAGRICPAGKFDICELRHLQLLASRHTKKAQVKNG